MQAISILATPNRKRQYFYGSVLRVLINGAKSEWIPVSSGIPQGTVLGPILFNVFTNDIVDNINSDIRLFADDCVCYRQICSHEDHIALQKDIHHLGDWAQ